MLYKYIATTPNGEKQAGSIEAANLELAISSLQRRNLIIISLVPAEKQSFFSKKIKIFKAVKTRDVVFLSRQLATLFEAKVPVLVSFKLLVGETESPILRQKLTAVIDDVQGGVSMSQAMSKHPDVFSRFYVNMVRSGEESGKLDEVFSYLADYMERSYELASKVKRALIYPAFVVVSFVIITTIMLVVVVPKLADIITESGQAVPFYTTLLIGFSAFFRKFGIFILVAFVIGLVFLWRYYKTDRGRAEISKLQLSLPFFGGLYKKFYVARITDTLETSLSSGVAVVRALEIASEVVGNDVYRKIMLSAANEVKSGSSISEVLSRYEDIPAITYQMIKIGEQSGKLSFILKTMSRFYKREVDNMVDTIVSMIEPALIIFLGLAVGFLVIAFLSPIYSITSSV